ncbi:MAG: transcriptional repressor [Dehalococcoidia bacterium]|nr:transcriptional repressor [Dehalococcoidia bacterium]
MSCHQVLKEHGYRLTPQRLMVVDAVHAVDRHISAEEIFEQVRKRYPYANISTVYRTLELLKELGLVVETDFGEGCLRYHHAEKGHHHHLVCRVCGRVTEVPEPVLDSLRERLAQEYRFQADFKHLAISGTCSECQNAQDSRSKQHHQP